MKLVTDSEWFKAMRGLRRRRPAQPDGGDMGTAFGLDSVTVVDFQLTREPAECTASPAVADWQRRVTRRSGL